LHKPVLICETGYPATAHIEGQFADWKHPVEGYPLNDDGQARWIADFAKGIRQDQNFSGVFYWSPEWYDGDLWNAFALFNPHGIARPGIRSFVP
jgi:arabinogalactan endo-1,4-beta-galactosidase